MLGTDKTLLPSPSQPFGGKLPVGDEGLGKYMKTCWTDLTTI